jgi:hypothetical protein
MKNFAKADFPDHNYPPAPWTGKTSELLVDSALALVLAAATIAIATTQLLCGLITGNFIFSYIRRSFSRGSTLKTLAIVFLGASWQGKSSIARS